MSTPAFVLRALRAIRQFASLLHPALTKGAPVLGIGLVALLGTGGSLAVVYVVLGLGAIQLLLWQRMLHNGRRHKFYGASQTSYLLLLSEVVLPSAAVGAASYGWGDERPSSWFAGPWWFAVAWAVGYLVARGIELKERSTLVAQGELADIRKPFGLWRHDVYLPTIYTGMLYLGLPMLLGGRVALATVSIMSVIVLLVLREAHTSSTFQVKKPHPVQEEVSV